MTTSEGAVVPVEQVEVSVSVCVFLSDFVL